MCAGAYIFRPAEPTQDLTWATGGAPIAVAVLQGALVVEVRQTFAPWLNQTIRLVRGATHVRSHGFEAANRFLGDSKEQHLQNGEERTIWMHGSALELEFLSRRPEVLSKLTRVYMCVASL